MDARDKEALDNSQTESERIAHRNRLAEQNSKLIYKAIHLHGGIDPQDIDDAFQEGMIALLRVVELWQPVVRKFSTYAMRAVFNRLAMFKSRRRQLPVKTIDPTDNPPAVQDDQNDHADELAAVMHAIAQLTDAEADMLLSHFRDGQPRHQIAKRHKINITTLIRRESKAMTKLRKLLGVTTEE